MIKNIKKVYERSLFPKDRHNKWKDFGNHWVLQKQNGIEVKKESTNGYNDNDMPPGDVRSGSVVAVPKGSTKG